MADEVYDGAIGIDLGERLPQRPRCRASTDRPQARPTHALPIMKEQTSKSVCDIHLTLLYLLSLFSTSTNLQCSRQRARKLYHPFIRLLHGGGAPHRRGCEEPGRHEPCQHSLRCQVS